MDSIFLNIAAVAILPLILHPLGSSVVVFLKESIIHGRLPEATLNWRGWGGGVFTQSR